MKTLLFLSILLAAPIINAAEKSDVVTSTKTENLGDKVILPKVSFHNTQLVEVIDFLQLRSREILGRQNNINFVILGNLKTLKDIRIKKMELKNVSLNTTLKILCKENNLTHQLDKEAVIISPKGYKRPVTMIKDDKGSGSKKLDSLTIRTLSMDGTNIEMSAIFLQMKSKELDAEKKGMKFNVQGDPDKLFNLRVRNLNLRSISLRAALKYTCEQSGSQYSVKGDTVTITPLTQ